MNVDCLYRRRSLAVVLLVVLLGGCATVEQLDQRSSFLSYRIDTSGKEITALAAELADLRHQHKVGILGLTGLLHQSRLELERNLNATERNKTEIQVAAMEIAITRVALNKFQEELQRQQQEMKALSVQIVNVGREVATSQSVNANLVADIDTFKQMLVQFNGLLETFQKSQIQVSAGLQTQLKNLSQAHQDSADAMAVTKERFTASDAELAKRLDQISMRLESLTKYLDWDGRSDPVIGKAGGGAPDKVTKESPEEGKNLSLEALYDLAYREFKLGNYERARVGFRELLARFPQGELPENAQFWIAEAYFFENNYERAIVEYEQILRNHSKGFRSAHALVKQGMSFQALGDNFQARLFFEQVLRDFPHSTQARIARSRLAKLN